MAVEVQMHTAALNRFLSKTAAPYLKKKAEEIAEEARKNAPVGATGDLRASVSVVPGLSGKVSVEVTAPYAGYVHQGTGPQANPPRAPYFPRLRRSGLILWSDSKGLNPYQVARGISRQGTPPNPFLEKAIETVLGGFNLRWISKKMST